MPDASRRVVIAGVSVRAIAASAARAGWQVTAVDAYGDLDLQACARVLPGRDRSGRFDPSTAAATAAAVQVGAAAYGSSFENHPSSVARLAEGRRLLGNPPAVLERVRDPLALARALRRLGFAAPVARASAPPDAPRHRWLLKPRRSGGGHGITAWRPGTTIGRRHYLQERIAGTPGSVLFLADGRRALVLGLSRQLVGQRAFGARGFRYTGSLVGGGLFESEASLLERAAALADAVAQEFALVGLNGIDFIARLGIPWPTEVNPRYSASMELLDHPGSPPLFALHAEACGGRLPATAPARAPGVRGKAVVFARRHLSSGDTHGWLRDPSVADVPPAHQQVARGRAICTVLASAGGADACLRALETKAAEIYRAVEPAARGVA